MFPIVSGNDDRSDYNNAWQKLVSIDIGHQLFTTSYYEIFLRILDVGATFNKARCF